MIVFHDIPVWRRRMPLTAPAMYSPNVAIIINYEDEETSIEETDCRYCVGSKLQKIVAGNTTIELTRMNQLWRRST